MGHIVEHVALELQTIAGMPVGFGRHPQHLQSMAFTRWCFEYVSEQAGRYAARAAVRLCNSLVETGHYPKEELEKDLADLAEFRLESALGPSTEAIVKEAEAKHIPWMQLPTRAMIQLGYGRYQQRVQATLSSRTSILGVELACDKEGTRAKSCGMAGVPGFLSCGTW